MNIVCMLVIYNDKKEILLQNRENIKVVWEDYSFFGGHVENWETPESCLKREINEELGIDLQDKDFEFIWKFNKNVYITNKNYDIYFYLYHDLKYQKNFIDKEWNSAEFWDIKNAKKLRFVADFTDILDFIKNKIKKWLTSPSYEKTKH